MKIQKYVKIETLIPLRKPQSTSREEKNRFSFKKKKKK
jgi:hypothetical protein